MSHIKSTIEGDPIGFVGYELTEIHIPAAFQVTTQAAIQCCWCRETISMVGGPRLTALCLSCKGKWDEGKLLRYDAELQELADDIGWI